MKAMLDIPIILADEYDKLVNWYEVVLLFEIAEVTTEGYHYTEFQSSGKRILGIADAREMGITPPEQKVNTVVFQIVVSDVHSLFSRIKEKGGAILFGPKMDKNSDYWYGGFLDIEGNQVWVVENREL